MVFTETVEISHENAESTKAEAVIVLTVNVVSVAANPYMDAIEISEPPEMSSKVITISEEDTTDFVVESFSVDYRLRSLQKLDDQTLMDQFYTTVQFSTTTATILPHLEID